VSDSKNPFKNILLPKNRKTLIAVIVLMSVVGAAIAINFNNIVAANSGLTGGSASYNASQVQEGSKASGTGAESDEYNKQVSVYNTVTIAEARSKNPSVHPIPVFGKAKVAAVGVVEPVKINMPAQPVADTKPAQQSEPCAANDQACIETRAELAGCLESDTQCLRDNVIIAPGGCAIIDLKCVSTTYASGKSDQMCRATDMACILILADKFQCSLADTQCLVARLIIPSNECAPSDPVCQRQDQTATVNTSEGLMGEKNPINRKAVAVIGQTSSKQYGEMTPQFTQTNTTSNDQAPAPTKYDQAYMAQAVNFVANKSASRKPVPISITFKREENVNTEQAQQEFIPQPTYNENEVQAINHDKPATFIKAGTQMFAVSDLALSSDYLGPVSLSILEAGPLYRAKLLGSMVHLEDKMRLELTKLVLTSGEEFTVNAVALDLKTTYAAVASKVDHHYLSRYGWWGFGTVLSAVGNATKLLAQQVQRNSDGSVTETVSLSTQQQARIALGEIGAQIGSVMRDRVNQPTTVHIDLHEELGIFFLDTVNKAR